MSSNTYPPALRSVLKAAPCLVMCLAASTVFWIYNYSLLRHAHDRVPRPSYKYLPSELGRPAWSTTCVCATTPTAAATTGC